MRARRSFPLLVASSVHVAALASVARLTPRSPASREAPPPARTELDLDESVFVPDDFPNPPSPSREDEPAPRAQIPRRALAEAHAEEAAPESNAFEPPIGSLENWTFSPTAAPSLDLRLASTSEIAWRSAAKGDGSPTTPEREEPDARVRSTTGGVAELLSAGEVSAGTGRGGAVLMAAEEAARADAVVTGEATFEIVVWRDGTSDVRMVKASEDADEWSRVAAALGSQVKGKKVRFPPGADGVRVTVHIDAKWKLPDGRDIRSLHGLRGGLTPSALQEGLEGKSKPEDRASTGPGGPDNVGGDPATPPPVGGAIGPSQGPNPAGAVAQGLAQRILPTPHVSVSGKVCSAALAVTPVGVSLGGGCSLENIGAVPAHQVAGQIVREDAVKRADAAH